MKEGELVLKSRRSIYLALALTGLVAIPATADARIYCTTISVGAVKAGASFLGAPCKATGAGTCTCTARLCEPDCELNADNTGTCKGTVSGATCGVNHVHAAPKK
jgi:hypothetical protein